MGANKGVAVHLALRILPIPATFDHPNWKTNHRKTKIAGREVYSFTVPATTGRFAPDGVVVLSWNGGQRTLPATDANEAAYIEDLDTNEIVRRHPDFCIKCYEWSGHVEDQKAGEDHYKCTKCNTLWIAAEKKS